MSSFNPNYLPKPPPANIITLGGRGSTLKLGRTQIFSLQQLEGFLLSFCVFCLQQELFPCLALSLCLER